MKDHEQRVVLEKTELDIKVRALASFTSGSEVFAALPAFDRVLLRDQLRFMKEYSNVLGRRIERFTID